MRIAELTIHGIRRFTGLHKLTLGGESAWVRMPVGGGRTTVASLIRAALDPAWFLSVQESLGPWRPQSDQSRFALTIETNGRRHRILRDARSGSVAAGRWQGEGLAFSAVAQTPEAIATILADEYDFPGPSDWADLCFWSDAEGDGAAPVASAGGAADAAQIQQQIEELLNEKTLMAGADKMQFELDGLEQKRFALDEELQKLGERLVARDQLKAEYAKSEALERAGERLMNIAGDYERLQDRHQQQRIERESALEQQREALASMREKPLWHRDLIFVGIAIGSLLGLIVPAVLKVYPASLLGFAGFGALGWRAFKTKQHIEATAAAERALAKARADLDEWISRHEHDVAEIQPLMEEFGALKPGELRKRWENRRTLREKIAALEREIEEQGVIARIEQARRERDEVAARIAKIEATMEDTLGGAGRDLNEIDREIAALERQLKMIAAGGTTAVASAGSPGSAKNPRDRIAAVLRAGTRIARRDAAALLAAVTPYASKIVAATMPGVIHEIQLDREGKVAWIGPDRTPLDDRVIHRGIELVTAVAVIVAVARFAAQTRSFPLVWDEPLADLDDVTLGRLGQILPKAGASLQFVVLSGRQALGAPFGKTLDFA